MFRNSFFHAKIKFLLRKRCLGTVSIELKCTCLQTVLADLKNHETLEFCLGQICFRFFFLISHFQDICKSSVAYDKIVECALFYLNMVEQTQQNLNFPLCDDTHFTTAARFRQRRAEDKNRTG